MIDNAKPGPFRPQPLPPEPKSAPPGAPTRFNISISTYLAGKTVEVCSAHRVTLAALRAVLHGILADLTPEDDA